MPLAAELSDCPARAFRYTFRRLEQNVIGKRDMLGWGITLMAVGFLSFILPIFGRQFAIVTLFGLTGAGSAVAGVIFFAIGLVLFLQAIKKEKEGANISQQPTTSETIKTEEKNEIFKIGEHSLFKGEFLSPKEFGKETARLGLAFGDAQTKGFFEQQSKQAPNNEFLAAAKQNQDFFILTLSALISGAFTCYSQLLLNASNNTTKNFMEGIAEGTKELLPSLSDNSLSWYVSMISSFSELLLNEVAQKTEDASTKLFIESVSEFYNSEGINENLRVPEALKEYLSGLGSRFMAVCQDEFKITIVRH